MTRVLSIAILGILAVTAISLSLVYADQPSTDAQVVTNTEAAAILEKTAQAYQQASTITDTMTLEFISPYGNEKETLEMVMGKKGNSRFNAGGAVLTTLDNQFYLEMGEVTDKYLQKEIETNIVTTMSEVLGESGSMPFHYLMRTPGNEKQYVDCLCLGMLANPVLSEVNSIQNSDNQTMHELVINADDGIAKVHISSKQYLIKALDITFKPPAAPDSEKFTIRASFDPRIADELDKPITFSPGKRTRVKAIEDLEPEMEEAPPTEAPTRQFPKAGDDAPDFSLTTPSGEVVKLSDLNGSVVVIDFWATWCGWCIKGMPLLQNFYNWSLAQDDSIKVFAVNSWERKFSVEERPQKIAEYWTGKGWTIPILLDLDGSYIKQYGFGGIPATVIIGPDGKIVKIHNGYSPQMETMLKNDVAKALE